MSSHPTLAIPQSVGQLITRYRTRKASLEFACWVGVGVTVGALLFVLSLVADRFIDLPAPARATLTAVTFAIPAFIFLAAFFRLFQRDPIEHSAGELDAATPGARDLLRSSVNFTARDSADSASNPFMLTRALEDAQALGQKVQTADVLPVRRLPLAFAGLLIALPAIFVIFQTPFMDASLLLQRFLHPLGNHPRPSLTKIVVDFPERIIQQGDDLTIRATLAGVIPADPRATLQLMPVASAPAHRGVAVVMNPRPNNQFEAVLKNIAEPATFTISSADGRSERHTIAVRARPTITSLSAEYVYPRYTLLPPKTEPVTLREFKGVEGTRVRINFESSIPVDKSKVIFPESQMNVRWDKARTKGSFQFTIEKDSKFTIQLASDDGTDNRNEAPFRVRLLPDNVPTVSLLGIPEDLSLYRDDLLNLSYKGSDDFGVSEVFIRYNQSSDPRMGRDFTLKSVLGTTKQVAGDFSLAIRDIATVEDSWVDIALVMVDSKGQEGVSPAVRLQVISSTPDRQLIELLTFQDRYYQSMSKAAGAMKAISSRLTVLLDGMDDATPISAARKQMVDEITRHFADVRYPLVTDDHYARVFLVSEYPYLPQRRTEDILSRAAMLPGGDTFAAQLAAIAKNQTPRQELLKLKAQVDAALPMSQAMPGLIRDTMQEGRLMLVSYLCSQFLAQPNAGPKGASEAATLLAEKQEERLAAILAQITALAPGEDQPALRAAGAALTAAAAKPATERPAALATALGELGKQIDQGGPLDGRLGTASEAAVKTATWSAVFQQAITDQMTPRAARTAASWSRLRRDNFVLNNAEIFLATVLAQAGQTGNPARLSQAVAATAPLQEWSRRVDLFDRAELLRRTLANMDIDVRAGRVNAKTPAFDQSWREVRDLMLSITSDAVAGRFAGISAEVDAALASLAPLRSAFTSWNAAAAVTAPTWDKSRADVLASLDKIVASLTPSVVEGRKQALALTAPLLLDIATNIAAEKPKLTAEQAAIVADVEAAAKAPPGSNGATVKGRQRGRMADGARVWFTRELSDRFTGYAVAAATLTDLRQSAWADQPSRDSVAELRVTAILFEYLSHLEEDVYDKTYAQHLSQVHGIRPYPGFIDEHGRYMGTLTGPIDTLVNGLTQLAAGKSAALVADPGFNDLPIKINKQQRFDAQTKSVLAQVEFVEAFRAATTDPARAALLAPMAKSFETPTAYWDRVYMVTRAVMEQADAATKVAEGTPWPGVEPAVCDGWAAAMARIVSVLPPAAEGGDEVKTLRAAIDDFASLRAKLVPATIAKLDAAGRNSAREELSDWRGKMEGAMRAMESRLAVPALKTRPRARLMLQRNDLDGTLGRILRSESMWTERVGYAARSTASTRAQLLSPDLRPVTLDDLAYDFAREGSVRRRSAAVSAQASRSLDIDTGGVDASFLKMPKYLYEELRKTLKKPYPSQFKDNALEYTQDLAKDAR